MNRCAWRRTLLDAHRARTVEPPDVAARRWQFALESRLRLEHRCHKPKSCLSRSTLRRPDYCPHLGSSDIRRHRFRTATVREYRPRLEFAIARGVLLRCELMKR